MPETKAPACVGIIMDGNRRFAREKGLPVFEGHRAGYETLKKILRAGKEAGISHLIFYTFSTENWNRSKREVAYLLNLMRFVLTKELGAIKREGFRIRCIGRREDFPVELQKLMARAEKETADLPGPTAVLALSYGGRAEVLYAANAAIAAGEKKLTERSFEKYLWTVGIPDPDLIIRTSGEKRLSGFLPWQGVYSELFFTPTLWPAFSKQEFFKILKGFAGRERRHGT